MVYEKMNVNLDEWYGVLIGPKSEKRKKIKNIHYGQTKWR